jgi:H+/Cl- antiporter ClcA
MRKNETESEYSKTIRHRRASVIESEKVRQTIPAWVACIAVGMLVGLADGAMIQSLKELFELKGRLLQWTTDHHTSTSAFFYLLAFCLPMTLLAACMVIFVAPKAAGSGLAEVKAMLNGSHIPGLLTFTTAFVKIVGIIFTIIGGLALGREGPMVHVGAAMANFILHVPYFYRRIIGVHTTRRAQAVFNVRSNYVNHYVIMGGAAGVAAAFNAPITGVLYMLEEMATHWPTWLTCQAFVCTSFAALTMQCIANGIRYSTHKPCSYTAHTVLIHYTHYTHTLHTLYSYTAHTILIHCTHYTHTLHTLYSYTAHTILIHYTHCAHTL